MFSVADFLIIVAIGNLWKAACFLGLGLSPFLHVYHVDVITLMKRLFFWVKASIILTVDHHDQYQHLSRVRVSIRQTKWGFFNIREMGGYMTWRSFMLEWWWKWFTLFTYIDRIETNRHEQMLPSKWKIWYYGFYLHLLRCSTWVQAFYESRTRVSVPTRRSCTVSGHNNIANILWPCKRILEVFKFLCSLWDFELDY